MTARQPQLHLSDLVHGLETFGDRYSAIDVFADDLVEARSETPVPGLADRGDGTFDYWFDAKPYRLVVSQETGVVRLSRLESPPAASKSNTGAEALVLGALTGAAIGAAASKKGDGAAAGLILGLLAGAALSSNTKQRPAPFRVFTLRFDVDTGDWRAYDGGLVPWMKEALLPKIA